ncbi:Mrp8 protein [Maudiozyma humilis]|uniref:Mrp8 protein n=1 Tax=Maudiozyma humilis TaxID=51915 RepID=A0AAV5S084_MAUHU|nr:Mrp8 protein [Kazachstania humilis]
MTELQSLKKRLDALEILVRKQNVLIGKTGQGMLAMQLDKQKSDLSHMPGSVADPAAGSAHAATDEDLVQLVAELQGELNNIEERSIRRMANAGKSSAKEAIAPMLNADGDVPLQTDEWFPKTVGDFESIPTNNLFRLAKFYERMPLSGKEQEKYEQYLDGKIESMKVTDSTDEDIAAEMKNYSPDQIDDIFNDVARYLGLPARRGVHEW